MSLLTPDSGLVFWMLLSFGIVVGILCKYGFPVILQAVETRKNYIAQSLEAAREAQVQREQLQATEAALLAQAKEQREQLLQEAQQTREQLIQEAREQARIEGQRQLEKALQQIQVEKQQALQSLHDEVADLALRVAEAIIRQQVEKPEVQQQMINRMLDVMVSTKA